MNWQHLPGPLIPLYREYERTWGLRTDRIEILENLAISAGYELSVQLMRQLMGITGIVERWLRDPIEQDKYMNLPPGGNGTK